MLNGESLEQLEVANPVDDSDHEQENVINKVNKLGG